MTLLAASGNMVLRDKQMRNVPQFPRICCADKTAKENENSPTYDDNLAVI